jgi:V8-like Glu-specific endopeptidase
MRILTAVLVIFLVPIHTLAQTAPAGDRMQQKYNRIERPQEEVLKDLEENDKDVVSVSLEQHGRQLVLHTQDAPLEVANRAQFSKYAQSIPYEYEISLNDGQAATVTVQAQQLTAVKRWRDSQFATKGDLTTVDSAYQKLDQRALDVVSPEATDADVDAFREQLGVTKSELVNAYRDAGDADMETQHAIIGNYAEVQRAGKALYGRNRDDRYPPETYRRIFENSRGSLALLETGHDVHCSGVLIARDFVLTNYHCVETSIAQDLRVRFDYEELIDGSTLPTHTLPVVRQLSMTSAQRHNFDFAVLETGVDAPDGNHAGDLYPVQCISLSRVKRDDPLYLIGYPLGNPRTVHDNTYVYFPFRVTEFELTELEMAVRSEFLGSDDEMERIEEFRNSYQERDAGGQPVYENFSLRWRRQPTIGIDSDTFHGNSGSPAYSRKTHRVIGILFDGEDDMDDPWQVGWRAHEAVLPIEVVVDTLDSVHPEWRDWQGVCLDE